MKVIENTLLLRWERWDDPGDYPSNAGAGPLPSYQYPVCEGELKIQLTVAEYLQIAEEGKEPAAFIEQLGQEDLLCLPNGIIELDNWHMDVESQDLKTGVIATFYAEHCVTEEDAIHDSFGFNEGEVCY